MSDESSPNDGLAHDHRRARRPLSSGALARTRHRYIGGVAGGVAEFVDAAPAVVRTLWVVSLPLSGGLTGLAYIILWALLPSNKVGAG
ncbi:MAG: PspC domain-containing protein [Trueperaceae bacterium]